MCAQNAYVHNCHFKLEYLRPRNPEKTAHNLADNIPETQTLTSYVWPLISLSTKCTQPWMNATQGFQMFTSPCSVHVKGKLSPLWKFSRQVTSRNPKVLPNCPVPNEPPSGPLQPLCLAWIRFPSNSHTFILSSSGSTQRLTFKWGLSWARDVAQLVEYLPKCTQCPKFDTYYSTSVALWYQHPVQTFKVILG